MTRRREQLAGLREEIASIDRSLLLLLAARLTAAQQAIATRVALTGSLTDGAQEARVLHRAQRWGDELDLPPALVERLFRALLEEGKSRQRSGRRQDDRSIVTVQLRVPSEPDPELGHGPPVDLRAVASGR